VVAPEEPRILRPCPTRSGRPSATIAVQTSPRLEMTRRTFPSFSTTLMRSASISSNFAGRPDRMKAARGKTSTNREIHTDRNCAASYAAALPKIRKGFASFGLRRFTRVRPLFNASRSAKVQPDCRARPITQDGRLSVSSFEVGCLSTTSRPHLPAGAYEWIARNRQSPSRNSQRFRMIRCRNKDCMQIGVNCGVCCHIHRNG
jgi:hypothetical protein